MDHSRTTISQTKMFDTLSILPERLVGDDSRVIALPFHFTGKIAASSLFDMVKSMTDKEVADELSYVISNFANRHKNIEERLEEHYRVAREISRWDIEISESRRLLIGAYFTMEYSLEAAGLLNPSIVPHPVQNSTEEGSLRFLMSFRAIGEGHISSTVFRTGIIGNGSRIKFDPPPRYSTRTRLSPDQFYLKPVFQRTLLTMGVNMRAADMTLSKLPERFTLPQLENAIAEIRTSGKVQADASGTFRSMLWVARSNYRLRMAQDADISELIIFPHSESESRGIEDMRLVVFEDEDSNKCYYGTYTGYDGYRILPMLMETKDFRSIAIHSLNGACAVNKGMALFPRKIKGHYTMCSRIDGRNLFIMYSDHIHFWESSELLAGPKYPWEYRLIGNCGSPLLTKEGWLLITHGVGPVREYAIGAMLLDLEDPSKIRGRLKHPLISPLREERDGYVPNVVYSCGSLIYNDWLYLPFGIADESTALATMQVQELLERLIQDGP